MEQGPIDLTFDLSCPTVAYSLTAKDRPQCRFNSGKLRDLSWGLVCRSLWTP